MPTDTSHPPTGSANIKEAEAKPRTRTKPIAFGIVVALLIAGTLLWLHYRNRESTDDAEINAHVEAVAPRVAGVVTEVEINDNQVVQPGQVLFRLDPKDYRAALQQAQANLEAAEAGARGASTSVPIVAASSGGNLSEAQAGLQSAEASQHLADSQVAVARAHLKAAQAQLAQAQAEAQYAATTEQRYAQLVKKSEVSELQFDQVRTAATAAAARRAAAQAQLAAAQQEVASSDAQVGVARGLVAQAAAKLRSAATAPQQLAVSRSQASMAEAKVAQAQAAVALAQLHLDYTVITAPSAGQVGNKQVELGQNLAPGETTLSIIPINEVWVTANFKETQLHHMHPGQRAEVSVDAFGVTLRGRVNSLGAGTGARFSLLPPENATGNFVKVVQRIPVKIVFDPDQDLSRLRPGMSVEATVFTH